MSIWERAVFLFEELFVRLTVLGLMDPSVVLADLAVDHFSRRADRHQRPTLRVSI